MIAGVINGHVACKYIYVRLFRGTDRMHQRGLVSIGTWVMIGLVLWTLAWIIAEAIPVFNDLLSLIVGSLIVCVLLNKANCRRRRSLPVGSHVSPTEPRTITILTHGIDGLSGIFWLFLNWGRYSSSRRKILLTGLNLLVVVVGGCLVSIQPIPITITSPVY